ncbi:MAG: cytochrome c [Rhodothermaceae bacterium]|nr:cytochrome c [Rhodothermaceae bacterium]
MTKQLFIYTFLFVAVALSGCRGSLKGQSPIHLNPNMDHQEKFEAQEKNTMFADERAMRPPVPGTVARGFLREDTRFYQGIDEAGELITDMPVPVTRDLLERGQERYEIYCTVCHGSAGDGKGVIMVGNGGKGYGYIPAPDYHAERLIELSNGHYYEIISNGTPTGTMPGYAQQIPVADRWAIIAYIRALQLSRTASGDDLSASQIPQ